MKLNTGEQNFKLVLRWVLVFLILLGFLAINWIFWSPVVIGGIFALGLMDSFDSLAKRLPIKRVLLSFLFTSTLVGILFLPFSLAIYRLASKVNASQLTSEQGFLNSFQALKDFVITKIEYIGDSLGWDITAPLKDTIEKISMQAAQAMLEGSSHILAKLPSLALSTIVFTLLLLTFLSKSKEVRSWFLKLGLVAENQAVEFIALLKTTCSTILLSTFLVGFVQALIIGIGSVMFEVGDFWVVLGLTFVFSFIPMVGAAPVGIVLAAMAFLNSQTGAGIGMAAFAVVAGAIDNVIKPLLVGRKIEAHPLLAFTSAIGAVALMGLPGLLVGPLIMNLFIAGLPLLIKGDK